MKEFENIVIGQSSIPALIITIILMTAIPVVLLIYWRKKHKEQTKISWLIACAVGFIVSARVLELAVHYFCIIFDNPVSRFINGHTVAFVIYGITMAGVFEECGRFIVMKYIMKKNRTRENSVLYGIGHGGIEIIAVLIPAMISSLAIAVMLSTADRATALGALGITEENAAVALTSVQTVATFDYGMMALNVIERILAMLLHIGLTVIVYYGITQAKKSCLPAAIGLHMLMDLFAALYQRSVVPLWSVEVWAAFVTGGVVMIAVKQYRQMENTEDEQKGSARETI